MQNIFLFIFLSFFIYSGESHAMDNLNLVNKLNEQKDFYKSQPRQKKTVDNPSSILPADFDEKIIDLESEFKKAENPSSRRRLR